MAEGKQNTRWTEGVDLLQPGRHHIIRDADGMIVCDGNCKQLSDAEKVLQVGWIMTHHKMLVAEVEVGIRYDLDEKLPDAYDAPGRWTCWKSANRRWRTSRRRSTASRHHTESPRETGGFLLLSDDAQSNQRAA